VLARALPGFRRQRVLGPGEGGPEGVWERDQEAGGPEAAREGGPDAAREGDVPDGGPASADSGREPDRPAKIVDS
jgi:hypothetical protein